MKDTLRIGFVALLVSALLLGLYDRFIRQPRTPRLAIVDVTQLYEAMETKTRQDLLDRAAPAAGAASGAEQQLAIEAVRRSATNFGPAVHKVLTDLSNECHCAIVAMAAVVGEDVTIPNYTAEAGKRLGIGLTASVAMRRQP